jgi:15-cis-phytoene synthase
VTAGRPPGVVPPGQPGTRRVTVHVLSDHRLRESYRTCRRLQRRHDPTYYCATRCLPRDVRPAVHAVYGYVRGADEIVDGPRRLPAGAPRHAALDLWELELERGLRAGGSDHPVIAALVDAGPRHGLPLELLPRYMAAMRVDCDEPVRIGSQAELDRYMEGTATVGRIVAPLLGAPRELHEQVARLGVAFQLTNFIRDVPLDWAMGRVYLPGLPECDLRAGVATAAVRERIGRQVARARALFAETAPVAGALVPAMRPGVRVARAVYARVLDRVERNGCDVLAGRARVAPWEGARAAAGALLR